MQIDHLLTQFNAKRTPTQNRETTDITPACHTNVEDVLLNDTIS